ncbi:hypothetical protein BCR35DRAFT_304925 [Leucosporidium creatinivorum]|uniref:Zn(2)-C6 fungal-type domain-containing protein n=1 Tax=Leucosporidium creatinivorum TaxID=106004 RepID=A0A1Y2F5F9_9BASI|nr:hypothetical protein BCR35DRAFT_304925 [Leucosporidium creatinivorum]
MASRSPTGDSEQPTPSTSALLPLADGSVPAMLPQTGKAPRVSQRAPSSCTFCYRRKIKCTKVFPCQPCIQRGIADKCEVEPVVVRGSLVVPAPAPKRVLNAEELQLENTALHRKLRQQERLIASLQRDLLPKSEGNQDVPPTPLASGSRPLEPAAQERENAIVGADLELLGMANVPHEPTQPSSSLARRAPLPSWQPPWIATNPLYLPQFLAAVPSIEQSTYLVEAHINILSYVHAVIHGPTFRIEHKRWIEALKKGEEAEVKWDWLALYFAIIASALYTVDDSYALSIGFTIEQIASLPRTWFDLAVDALQRCDYLSNPTITALQAICVFPMIGYTFGASAYIRGLLHSANHSAQMLHFHLLGPETRDSPLAGQTYRELGRRIWACLVIGEWMTLVYTETSMLAHPMARSCLPSNINDEQLSDSRRIKPLPLSTPTLVSHLLSMSLAAEICKSFADQFHSVAATGDLDKQYAIVVEHDRQLLKVLDFCPALKPSDEPYPTTVDPTTPFDYIPWSRHLWATMVPPGRIRWYRHFLGRSFSDPRFSDARQICLEAARMLIKERKRPVPAMFKKSWHVSAHTVLSGMVLATEYVHGSSDSDTRRLLRAEILEVVDLLRRDVLDSGGGLNTILPRGIQLITHLIGEDLESPSMVSLEGISTELPAETLWPALDVEFRFDDWISGGNTGGGEMWNLDGSFNWEWSGALSAM